MSLMVLGANGAGGDLCTLRGLRELRKSAARKKSVLAFLNDGKIEHEEMLRSVLAEVANDAAFEDMRLLLRKCTAPIVLTDGLIEER